MSPWNRDQAEAALLSRINHEANPAHGDLGSYRLNAIRELLHGLGDPQTQIPFVHVAGTKGKGSTSAMIASLLQAAGYRVGLYTSPHLERIEERIAIDGEPISGDAFASAVADVLDQARRLDDRQAAGTWSGVPATYFDLLTATAWCAFRAAQVEVAVIEVGMGGRLDSTNVAIPLASVITKISFDHTKQLGNTLSAIAGEKAGIVKPGIPVISAQQAPEAELVIRQRAAELGAPLFEFGTDFQTQELVSDSRATSEIGNRAPRGEGEAISQAASLGSSTNDPFTPLRFEWRASTRMLLGPVPAIVSPLSSPMLGVHQLENSGLAIAATACAMQQGNLPVRRSAARNSDPSWVERGVARAAVAGRIEKLQSEPTVFVDVAHNPAAIDALLSTLRPDQWRGRRTALIAISEDKDWSSMLQRLATQFDRFIVTRFVNNPRALAPEKLAEELNRFSRTPNPDAALKKESRMATVDEASANPAGASVTVLMAKDPQEAIELLRQSVTVDELVVVTGSTFLIAETRSQLLQTPLKSLPQTSQS